jgi:hypothetical protein
MLSPPPTASPTPDNICVLGEVQPVKSGGGLSQGGKQSGPLEKLS